MDYKIDFSIVDVELEDFKTMTLLNLVRLVNKYKKIIKNKTSGYNSWWKDIRDYSIKKAIATSLTNNEVVYKGLNNLLDEIAEKDNMKKYKAILKLWIEYIEKKLEPIITYIEEQKVINDKQSKMKTNEYLLERIKCPHCGETINRNYLARHLKTQKCINKGKKE